MRMRGNRSRGSSDVRHAGGGRRHGGFDGGRERLGGVPEEEVLGAGGDGDELGVEGLGDEEGGEGGRGGIVRGGTALGLSVVDGEGEEAVAVAGLRGVLGVSWDICLLECICVGWWGRGMTGVFMEGWYDWLVYWAWMWNWELDLFLHLLSSKELMRR